MLLWERKAKLSGASFIIGLDEAGRGPLAGPVVAAAVSLGPSPLKKLIFPRYKERIDDSKKMLPAQRERSFCEISKKALFGVGIKDHRFIDRKNIQKATVSAMRRAVRNLVRKYCRLNGRQEKDARTEICILVDGNIDLGLPYHTLRIIKGDSKSFSIAAASIVAKVTRDRLMASYDKEFPQYGFLRHKGYGTKSHMEAIERYGPCPIHRRTFAPIKTKWALQE